ncbi:MAG: 2-isopropylmalate synthase [Rickettsiales bacterium]|jgi:2-isopropylmalate synthase|nr:2-isopropylmalate synthase [Rickettsiales bacterium]
MNNKIYIFDTTLRDGEQSPGASMTFEEKLLVAESLDNMGVDVIEAGFAISSPGDFEAVNTIAKRSKNSIITSLARTKEGDIDRAVEAVKPAKQGRVHIFVSTSPVHMKWKLKMEPDAVFEMSNKMVVYAKNKIGDLEWSAEDATRTEFDFLCKCVESAIKNGATTINLPDTVGYTNPTEYYEFIKKVITNVPNSDKAVFSTHCHNDLGMATANSLSALNAGARQVECTINGLGERAGNAAMEEVVMAIKTRNDLYPYSTNINTKHFANISRLVSTITGFPVQKNKAIVGANAFSHASGVHQDGMLKNRETYEIMQACDVGFEGTELVLGKLSGKNAFKDRLKQLNVTLDEEQITNAFERFKKLCDYKKDITNDDIIAIISDKNTDEGNEYVFVSYDVTGDYDSEKTASLNVLQKGKEIKVEAKSMGSMNAVFNAINKLTNIDGFLESYNVNSIGKGVDSIASVSIVLQYEGKIFSGEGRDIDTIASSAKAYLNAINKVVSHKK